ncbi:MAG: late competence development ComFB family protein [Pseudanabaenaceae cyanobacterium bins.68]|nr:late competence development ComFB family protein [Pseudanabaenaceae cyanobacterium bins.68]
MEGLVNLTETAVIKEANRQLARLPEGDRALLHLKDVVAYSLNCLPCMYANSAQGWDFQHRKITTEMTSNLENVVYWAIRNIITNDRNRIREGSPARDRSPLPHQVLTKPPYVLHQLGQILNQPYLEWAQVPAVTRQAIADLTTLQTSPKLTPRPTSDPASRFTSSSNRALVTSIKGYLQRSHVKEQDPERSKTWLTSEQPKPAPESAHPESEAKQLYMAAARVGYINVMEEVVTLAARSMVKTVRMGLQAKIKLSDVVTCALNLLPPMYATTEFGLKFCRYKVKTEMVETINQKVREAIMRVCNAPLRQVSPSPIAAIQAEQNQAIAALSTILEHEQVTWQNLVALVEQKLNRTPRQDHSLRGTA